MTADDTDADAARSGGLAERLLPPVDPLGADGEPKPSRMERREQLVAAGLGFANVAIAAGAAATIDRHQVAAFLAGLVASGVTVAGARLGNRLVAILGLFACVVSRNADTMVFLAFGLPYYAAAMWMFLRYNRLVKAKSIQRRQQRSSARGPSTSASTSGKGATAATKSTAKRPTASKRYTPPKPPKKRPPPPPKPPRDRSIVD